MPTIEDRLTNSIAEGLSAARSVAAEGIGAKMGRQGARLRSGAKTRKSAATRERIMAAATDLMVERGNTDFQMSEVSARCNMSKGALYYYFSDKNALVGAIYDRSADELLDAAEQAVASARSALEALRGLSSVVTCHLRTTGPLSLAVSRELLVGHTGDVLPSVETHLARLVSIVEEQVERGKREGSVRPDVDSRLAAVSTCGSWIFAALEMTDAGTDPQTGTALAGSLADVVLHGIAAPNVAISVGEGA